MSLPLQIDGFQCLMLHILLSSLFHCWRQRQAFRHIMRLSDELIHPQILPQTF